jgi:hypothetical protein
MVRLVGRGGSVGVRRNGRVKCARGCHRWEKWRPFVAGIGQWRECSYCGEVEEDRKLT